MGDFYSGYTLADILGLAYNNTLTYRECTEILEERLIKKFPGFESSTLYSRIKKQAANDLDYCERLVKAGKQLEELARN